MKVCTFGHNYEIDIHGLTVAEAKRELISFLNRIDNRANEVEVIHGYQGGQALLNFVRKEFKHPRVEKKLLSLNQGITTLKIKPKQV